MKQNLAALFFTKTEQERIIETVRRVERLTTGEIVPVVISQSHAYPEALITGAAVFALPFALLSAFSLSSLLWWQGETLWLFLLFFAVFFLLARVAVAQIPSLIKFFLSPHRVEREVEQGAFTHFFSEGLHATRDATGVLIYISVLERRVWILGDSGINKKIPTGSWQLCVTRLTEGIRAGRSCEALCAVIDDIGTQLQAHFPPKDDDRDELSNLVIINDQRRPRLIIK